ncbi:hypothetical protein CTAYLR_005890 [Chrysophaeum taylorii]|uniref:peptidylprolyl isomerase n=1 Tax=Chrysophaeum taylorii TaxID=2483200 RepID=A0AAD7UPE7_9STRA|nr:hypothetical protein CTAYLR_005863 [Chrysophaeum taylorii]KAJ8614311.1 hypothetical protein CTAYLR_005890 [Chrysophaeum taylorii]
MVEAAIKRARVSALPSGERYEKSYAHRDSVRLVVGCDGGVLATASRDGRLKLWKKMRKGIEFVKEFHAHVGCVRSACAKNGFLCTLGQHDAKVYDVRAFDMVRILRLAPFEATACVFLGRHALDFRLAIGGADGTVKFFSSSFDLVKEVSLHSPSSIACAGAGESFAVSADARGVIEYWDGEGRFPPHVRFRHKVETDLYALAKAKVQPVAIEVSASHFSVTAKDSRVRVFELSTGKLVLDIDASKAGAAAEGDGLLAGKRRELETRVSEEGDAWWNAPFDETGSMISFGSAAGVTVAGIDGDIVKVLGAAETADRYLGLALLQQQSGATEDLQLEHSLAAARGEPLEVSPPSSEGDEPVLAATALGRKRFYLFTTREPPDDRDVRNEAPTALEQQRGKRARATVSNDRATLRTTKGDIRVRLFPSECPKTCENFATHARAGYYDGLIFHRVIKGFMLQTGDPDGDGTGGVSIWGGDFEDEIRPSLKHDRPFVVSMANAGPNTNGSQFFITTVPTPWLDGKHTVFGRVTAGMDTCTLIENVKTDRFDKPKEDVKILSIDLSSSSSS